MLYTNHKSFYYLNLIFVNCVGKYIFYLHNLNYTILRFKQIKTTLLASTYSATTISMLIITLWHYVLNMP